MGDDHAKISAISPIVSVVLPVMNGETTLRVAIDSILAQSFVDFELIVIDDGSTDHTRSIVQMLNDPRIRFVSDGVNKGLATRLNEGVQMARGKYIARMDADDVSFPTRLERQVAFLENNPDVDLVGAQAIVFGNDGHVIGKLPFREIHTQLTSRVWSNIPIPHPTWMGRAAWFRANPYRMPEVKRAEDQELLLRCAPFSRYATLPDVLLGYRQGAFNRGKTLIARWHLLLAQLGLFIRRGQYGNAVFAILATATKVVIDLLAAIPGLSWLYFIRMKATNMRDQDIAQLRYLLGQGARP